MTWVCNVANIVVTLHNCYMVHSLFNIIELQPKATKANFFLVRNQMQTIFTLLWFSKAGMKLDC